VRIGAVGCGIAGYATFAKRADARCEQGDLHLSRSSCCSDEMSVVTDGGVTEGGVTAALLTFGESILDSGSESCIVCD
jgi:hypothetical protein